jgi:hypothetical protein
VVPGLSVLLISVTGILLVVAVARVLYRRNLFLRI